MTPDSQRRVFEPLYVPQDVAYLKDTYQNIDWDAYFANTFPLTPALDDNTKVVLPEEEFLQDLNDKLGVTGAGAIEPEVVGEKSLIQLINHLFIDFFLANYLHVRRLLSVAGDGAQELTDIYFRFTQARTGQVVPNERGRTCYKTVNSDVRGWGYAVGKVYVEERVPFTVKGDAEALIEDLRVGNARMR